MSDAAKRELRSKSMGFVRCRPHHNEGRQSREQISCHAVALAPGDRGTQGRGGLVEDGAHQRGLVAAGERQAALPQFEPATPGAQRSIAAGFFSVNLATRTSGNGVTGLGCFLRRD